MKTNNRVWALVAAAALALSLGACGGGGGSRGILAPAEDQAVIEPEVQQPFEGYETRDPAELEDIKERAISLAQGRKDAVADDAEEAELNTKVNSRFTKGNEYYAAGNYEKAQKRYEKVLSIYPMHYGANVNLTLALLQQEKNEEALVQSLACCYQFGNHYEPLLNAQTAGVACGFAITNVEDAMEEAVGRAGYDYESLKQAMSEHYGNYYRYNELWATMETDLHDVAQGGENDGTAGNAYKTIDEGLTELESSAYADDDMAALHAYLYAVGLQLGYRVDPSMIDPVHTMPFIAVDDELCKIEFMQIMEEPADWTLSIEVTNKLEEQEFSVGYLDGWTANGTEVEGLVSAASIAPGDPFALHVTLHKPTASVSADSSEDEEAEVTLTSFTGSLSVYNDKGELARYPVSWEAAAD